MNNTRNDPNSCSHEIHSRLRTWPACWASLALLLIFANWAGPAQQSIGQNEPVRTTKKEILAAVKKNLSRIQDLTISFSFNALGGPPSMYRRTHFTAVVKGSKTYFDREYTGKPKNESSTQHNKISYNGKQTANYSVKTQGVSVTTENTRETRTQGKGLFDMMLLNPPRKNYKGRSDQSLVSLLRSGSSRLRKHIEVVDSHPCYVIDLYHTFRWFNPLFVIKRPKRSMTVWLDKDRGFLPIRSVYYTKPDFEKILMQFVIDEAVEIEEGLWFAVKGRKSVYGGMWPTEYVLEVDGWKDGKPSIAVNSGVQDVFFDLWKRLPPGIKVRYNDTNESKKGLWIPILVGAVTVLAIVAFVTIKLRRVAATERM